MSPKTPRHRRIFRTLLHLLPFEMRADYGEEMEEVFEQQQRSARHRPHGMFQLWWSTIWGFLTTAPREHLETLQQDVAFAVRLMRKNPGFTAAVVLTLAVGLGANTLVFSLVEATLLRPLPYPTADRLMRIFTTVPEEGTGLSGGSLLDLEDWRQELQGLDRIAAYEVRSGTLGGDPDTGLPAQRVPMALVTTNLFDTLAVQPLYGRLFAPAEDQPGQDQVVIVSHAFWQARLGGDPRAVGQRLTLEGESVEVAGILPPATTFPIGAPCDLWKPIGMVGDQAGPRGGRWLSVLGRRAPGVSPAEAQDEIAALAAVLADRYPETNRGLTVRLQGLQQATSRGSRDLLLVLWVAVALVLLIVCANTANLLLARGAGRRQELAVRASLGARRGRLLRQLQSETFLLALLGGALGLGFAALGLRLLPHLSRLSNGDIPRLEEAALNPQVLAFTLGLSLLTGLLCGLLPALRVSQSSLQTSLRTAGKGGDGKQHAGRRLLVAAEVALAVVVLVGAGLVLRSFDRLANLDPGFETENVLTLRVEPPWEFSTEGITSKEDFIRRYFTERSKMDTFYQRLVAGAESLPGVESVAAVNRLPLSGNAWAVYLVARTADGELTPRRIGNTRVVTEDYFSTLRIPLIAGRLVGAGDRENSPPVVVVNRALAEAMWPGEDPLGKKLTADNPEDGEPFWAEVVGVVENQRHIHLDQPTAPVVYRILAQAREGFFQDWGMDLLIRTSNHPRALIPAVQDTLAEIAPELPAFQIRTLEEILQQDLSVRRFSLVLLTLFAVSALLLAVIGLYGVLAYAVGQRSREMGVRIALGAAPRRLLGQVVSQGMVPVCLGLGVGLAVAAWASRYLSTLLFEISETDPVTFAATAVVLLTVGALASYLPARRATQVDPVTALRQD